MEFVIDGTFNESEMFDELDPGEAEKLLGFNLSTLDSHKFETIDLNDDLDKALKKKPETKKRKRKAPKKKKRKKVKRAFQDQLEDSKNAKKTVNMDAWKEFKLHDGILQNLSALGFEKPTPIQKECLQLALSGDDDIFGAAQTGSGKTLAFGLPIIQKLYRDYPESKPGKLFALLLAPTRELAIQVHGHLKAVLKNSKFRVCSVVGGMNELKQERQIKSKPEIVVATPGRYHSMSQREDEVGEYLRNFTSLKCLVLDEADRLLEESSFFHLKLILEAVKHAWNTGNVEEEKFAKSDSESEIWHQTFVFSATLTLQSSGRKESKEPIFETLARSLPISNPRIIDLSQKSIMADKLTEALLKMPDKEKDAYLYYLLTKFNGRTLVFSNAISIVKKIYSLLSHLKVKVFMLHAAMKQKQRLKQLDRFVASANGCLICTDVAARGLDIKNVEHVIHFHIPRTAEMYVHRSGRVARAGHEGFCIALCSPQEWSLVQKLDSALRNRERFSNMKIDQGRLKKCGERIRFARELDKLLSKNLKKRRERSEMEKLAKEAGLEIDEDMFSSDEEQEESVRHRGKIKRLKGQLNVLLKQSLIKRRKRSVHVVDPYSIQQYQLKQTKNWKKDIITD